MNKLTILSTCYCDIIIIVQVLFWDREKRKNIIRKLLYGDPVDGWASTICVIAFIGEIQLFCMGIMGQYIAKTYSESKRRPHYIISESSVDTDRIR